MSKDANDTKSEAGSVRIISGETGENWEPTCEGEWIDYEGCDPVIADHLKHGFAPLCNVVPITRKEPSVEDHVTGFMMSTYITKSSCYGHATPILKKKTERRVLGHMDMMNALLERGYTQTSTLEWESDSPKRKKIRGDIFTFCGERIILDDLPRWLTEEVER